MKIFAATVAAITVFAGSAARATPESDAAFEQGQALNKTKDYAGAAAKFEIVVAADSNNDLAWYMLASASRQAGHCDRAIVAYKRYMDLVPTMPDPYYGLGLCLLSTGDKLGALTALRHFVAVAPAKSSSWRAHAASVVQELSAPPPPTPAPGSTPADAAVPAKPAPSPATPAFNEAQLLRDRGHVEEAIVKFKQAIALDPRHSAARTALGELLLKIRRDDEAITVLRACVDKNPTYSLAWYDLAFALRTRGQYPAAVDAYEHYIKLKPGDPDPYYGLGRSLQHMGRATDARRAFETYLSLEKRPSEQRWIESAEAQLRTLAAAK
ncbi:MAG TPA: tetratricopeptide repeat protein [Polyangia bacterium]|nr:tetratricopeptide repeat protein [Polyangia bacterium]